MKLRTINGVKVKVFEREDIINKLKGTEEDWNLINKYQLTFPELLQDCDGFIIDGETLCKELDVGSNFNEWLLANRKSKVGKLVKYNCIENIDYIVNREIAKNPKGGRPTCKITLTLECAKKIAMRQNNEMGDLVCNYFILVEKMLRNYESWIGTREPEKENWKYMISCLDEWCKKRDFDYTDKAFRIREANLLNISLTGYKASELRTLLKCKDNVTRDNLTKEINKALDELQIINSTLLIGNLDYEVRKQMIVNTCKSKYSNLYLLNK